VAEMLRAGIEKRDELPRGAPEAPATETPSPGAASASLAAPFLISVA
jgi:hypothetical protein